MKGKAKGKVASKEKSASASSSSKKDDYEPTTGKTRLRTVEDEKDLKTQLI